MMTMAITRIRRRMVRTTLIRRRRSIFVAVNSSSSSLHTDISTHRQPASTIPRYRIDFSRIQKVSDAVFLFDDMLRMRPLLSLRAFSEMLKLVVKMEDYSLALHMFDKMRQCSFACNEYTLAIAINCYCLLNRVDLAFSIFGMFFKSGLVPDVTTFNTLIRGLFLDEKVTDAVLLFKKLSRENLCEPDEVTFGTVIDGLCKFGMEDYSLAIHMFDEMRQCGVCYNEYTLAIVINCYCLLNRVDLGFSIFGIFVKSGLVLDVTTFNTLIRGLFMNDKGVDAVLLFKKLSRENICEPDEVTFGTVIDGLCKLGNVHVAVCLLGVLVKRSCKPNVLCYSPIIDGFCKDGMVDHALQLFSKMDAMGVKPNLVTYNSILQGLCDFRRWKEAKELLNKMISLGVLPDVFTCNILIDAFAKEGNMKEAKSVLAVMMVRNVAPDIVTYSALIEGYCLRGEMEKAREVFDLVSDFGLQPNIITYSTMLHGFCQDGLLKEAMDMFAEMEKYGPQPNVTTFTIIIGGLCQLRLLEVAKRMFMKMEIYGCTPNYVTYYVIVKGCLKRNDLEEAQPLLEEMKNKALLLEAANTYMLLDHCVENGGDGVPLDTIKKMFQLYRE